MAPESRSRMVSFRLTEEEYERFRRVCMSTGLRNVSELVRVAVNQLMNDISTVPETSPELGTNIHLRVATLEAQLAELASHFQRLKTIHFAPSADGQ
jgi:hypothetical protein